MLQEAKAVDHLPMTGDLLTNDVIDRLSREAQPLPSRGQAYKVARMRSLGAPANANAMFRGNEIVDGESQIGKACPRVHHSLAISRMVERLPFPLIAGIGMNDVLHRHQPINGRQFAGIPNNVVQLANDTGSFRRDHSVTPEAFPELLINNWRVRHISFRVSTPIKEH